MSDADLEKFKRDIHLGEYAVQRAGYEFIRRESSKNSIVLRHPANNDKVVVARGNDGHWTYFSVRDERDNGSIVDFVQRRENKNLGQVKKHLREWLGMPQPPLSRPAPLPQVEPIPKDRSRVQVEFEKARAVVDSAYLNRRGLRPETLQEPRFAGTWREDARGNTLFVHRDPLGIAGFEIKNDGFTGFATGGTKAVWHSVPQKTDNRLVIAESAIDALSYHQLHREENQHARYLSTAGALSPAQAELIRRAIGKMPPGGTIVAAVDQDAAGSKCAQALERLTAQHPQVSFLRHSPELALGKDWNAVLQREEREFIRSLPPRAPTHTRHSIER